MLYGIFRYLYLVHQKEQGGAPTDVLLTDRPLLRRPSSCGRVAIVLIVYTAGRRARCRWAAEPPMTFEIEAEGVDVER